MAKILVATISFDSSKGGGGVRLAYELATELVQSGHEITVICEDLHNRNLEKEVINGVTVLRYRLPSTMGLDLWRHERHFRAIRQVLKKHFNAPPDIVHGHSLFQFMGALKFYNGKVRSCYTIHSPFVEELKIVWAAQGLSGQIKIALGLPIIRQLEKECLMNSNILIAKSEFTRSLIQINYGEICSKRIKVIFGWTDLQRFVPLPMERIKIVRDELGWPKDRPIFFVLRRLEARMGLDNLLRALVLVKKQGYYPFTVIGGDGSLMLNLVKLRDSLGLRDDVLFMGFVPANHIALAYSACDASVVPTAQLECFGIIALEALACGKSTLVTPVGALPEVMKNFESQWIAFSNTPEDLSHLLCRYLNNSLPVHTSDRLRGIIQKYYTLERAVEAYKKVLFNKDSDC